MKVIDRIRRIFKHCPTIADQVRWQLSICELTQGPLGEYPPIELIEEAVSEVCGDRKKARE